MTTQIEAMKTALDALGTCEDMLPNYHQWLSDAKHELRAAIEAAEKAEPVAWMHPAKDNHLLSHSAYTYGKDSIPLYLHPSEDAEALQDAGCAQRAASSSLPDVAR